MSMRAFAQTPRANLGQACRPSDQRHIVPQCASHLTNCRQMNAPDSACSRTIGRSHVPGDPTGNAGDIHELSPSRLRKQSIAMFAAGAVLGPFCDGQHSINNVLHYHSPVYLSVPAIGFELETCWWVPVLFGVAGVILGVSYPVLDVLQPPPGTSSPTPSPATSNQDTNLPNPRPLAAMQQCDDEPSRNDASSVSTAAAEAPSWPTVLLCMALFVAQYGLSGRLEDLLLDVSIGPIGVSAASSSASVLTDTLTLGAQASAGSDVTTDANGLPALDVCLGVYALLHFAVFDRTLPGLFMSTLTALSGPAIEIFLIQVAQLYNYEHPFLWGVPSWIPWVYFCGGPAVGLLGRRVWADLAQQERMQQ